MRAEASMNIKQMGAAARRGGCKREAPFALADGRETAVWLAGWDLADREANPRADLIEMRVVSHDAEGNEIDGTLRLQCVPARHDKLMVNVPWGTEYVSVTDVVHETWGDRNAEVWVMPADLVGGGDWRRIFEALVNAEEPS